MVKQYNVQYFTAIVNGKEIEFRCYTTDTRCGFCHTAHYCGWDYPMTDTKASYYNRTWERFDYESVLKRAIEKLPTEVRQQVYDQLIDRKAAEEHEKAEAFIKSFETAYNGLNSENKERLAKSGIEVHTEEQAKAVAGLVGLMNLMQ
jgi:NADH:ubiquinone oxidoreductase subunit C